MTMRRMRLGLRSYSSNAAAASLKGYLAVMKPPTSTAPEATSWMLGFMSWGVSAREPMMLISPKYSGKVEKPRTASWLTANAEKRPPGRSMSTAARSDSALPDASMTTSAPLPPVRRFTSPTASSTAALMTWCAPMRSAMSSFHCVRDTAITGVAPVRTARRACSSPAVPMPSTTTDSAVDTATRCWAWRTVARGELHELRQRPLDLAAEQARVTAQVARPTRALVALPAGDDRVDDDVLARLQAVDALAHCIEDPRRLVTHHHRIAHARVLADVDRQVGVAH